jgi:hypothetical protein
MKNSENDKDPKSGLFLGSDPLADVIHRKASKKDDDDAKDSLPGDKGDDDSTDSDKVDSDTTDKTDSQDSDGKD